MPSLPNGSADGHDPVAEVIAFFNATCSTNYRPSSKGTRQKITARLRDGFTVEDCKTVILKKHADWADNPKMSVYLRPETLFAPSHFESYLNQPHTPPRARNPYFAMLEGVRHDPNRDHKPVGAHQDGLP